MTKVFKTASQRLVHNLAHRESLCLIQYVFRKLAILSQSANARTS